MSPRICAAGVTAVASLLAGCTPSSFDLDLRDRVDGAFSTTSAANQAVAQRPQADNRGVISYPTYQVAVAQSGDTVDSVAQRVGLSPEELANYNGLPRGVSLRAGEVIALPSRVAEPSPATGASQTGPVLAAAPVTTSTLEDRARGAINRSEGQEPQRHQVARGETAYSIARAYGVPVASLAEWNGLGENPTVREGQFLMIPVASAAPAQVQNTEPGSGTVAPPPPSASQPLPDDDSAEPGPPPGVPESPDLAAEATEESGTDARLLLPVSGPIVRAYSKGTNDGIDISASGGTPVRAADGGTVAAITRDTDQVPILVLRHSGGLLTVYAGVDNVVVEKGDSVSRGETIAQVRNASPSVLHFEVREGFESVDPVGYLP